MATNDNYEIIIGKIANMQKLSDDDYAYILQNEEKILNGQIDNRKTSLYDFLLKTYFNLEEDEKFKLLLKKIEYSEVESEDIVKYSLIDSVLDCNILKAVNVCMKSKILKDKYYSYVFDENRSYSKIKNIEEQKQALLCLALFVENLPTCLLKSCTKEELKIEYFEMINLAYENMLDNEAISELNEIAIRM